MGPMMTPNITAPKIIHLDDCGSWRSGDTMLNYSPLDIHPVVIIVEKSCLSPIPALCNVVWNSGLNYPRHPSHVNILDGDVCTVNN